MIRWIALCIILIPSFRAKAQSDTTSIEAQLIALELELDSISLFGFLDSLLQVPIPKSEINVRMGYSSSRLSAGRDFNLEQKGYTSGLAYYHKSGVYFDFSTFFDTQYSKAAFQSILHGGYFWLPDLKWTVNPYIERTFFHQDYSSDLYNSIGNSITRYSKVVNMGLDYAFLWGKDTGHRLIPSLSKSIKIHNLPLIKNLTLRPSISMMAGTTSIFTYQYSSDQIDNYLLNIQELTDDEIRLLVVSGQITTAQAIQLRVTRRLLLNGNEADRQFLKELLNTLEEESTFALLNITLSLPVSFSINKTNVLMSYSYAIPQRLPGEDLGVNPSGYFNLTITQRLTW